MGIDVQPEKFAELVVKANPSENNDAETIAKDSLELYITAYRLAEKYRNCSVNSYEISDALKETLELELNLKK